MRTLRLTIEYDGTELCGWQRQENGPTVQAHLEDALAAMTGHAVRITGASRTDAGVHALGQVAHFHTDSRIPPHGFVLGLNSSLPQSIAVIACDDMVGEFNARFDARGKHYRYDLWTRRQRSPLHRWTSWHRPVALDAAAMGEAARHLVGERDFAAFRGAGCTAKHTMRRITSLELSRPETHLLRIDVEGNAFLRHMVRIVAGTLVAVGEGKLEPGDLPAILEGRDRSQAGPTAPACGLTLVEVYYAKPHP